MLSVSYFILPSFTVSFCNTRFLCAMNVNVSFSLMKIKNEADSNVVSVSCVLFAVYVVLTVAKIKMY